MLKALYILDKVGFVCFVFFNKKLGCHSVRNINYVSNTLTRDYNTFSFLKNSKMCFFNLHILVFKRKHHFPPKSFTVWKPESKEVSCCDISIILLSLKWDFSKDSRISLPVSTTMQVVINQLLLSFNCCFILCKIIWINNINVWLYSL